MRHSEGVETVALCIICHERPAELDEALASAGDAFSEIIVLDMASDPPLTPRPGVRWIRLDENAGVATGRNHLAERASAEVLVFLDDDAVLLSNPVPRLLELFSSHDRLGAVAFKITRVGGVIEPSEFPFRGAPRHVDEPRPCAYFVGAGYAVSKQALDVVGGYDASFFYSTEEVDLSFNLFREGWELRYEPSIVVEHRPSAHGRSIRPQVPAMRARNRWILAKRHLPWPLAVVHVGAWTLRTFGEARAANGLSAWSDAWLEGVRSSPNRRPLPLRGLWALHRAGGRVLW